jgi:aryl-alcohol dehydrogenase-like predicted oxidoreductase
MEKAPLPTRALGRTGHQATLFGLGGEGVLRTHGRTAEAVAVIGAALEQGVNYFDTAPAYDECLDYYGAALGGYQHRVYVASKTHDRTRDGSLRLLENILRRLRTDRLDLWQLHDLRSAGDLQRVFAGGGALEALVEAREQGVVRHLGVTGHHDPNVLSAAIRRFPFDAVLVALNAADVHRQSFLQIVVPEAVRRGTAVIAMKVCGAGTLIGPQQLSIDEALGYVWSQAGVSTAIVGCQTPGEVLENCRAARDFAAFSADRLRELEDRTRPQAALFTSYKKLG